MALAQEKLKLRSSKNGAVKSVNKNTVPYDAKILTGRFAYTIKNKPVNDEAEKTEAHIDLN